MPFVSDKQRRYLWSQKPEVAKKFAEHHFDGGMAGMDNVKKVTQKDRYGNQISYEFESPVKPIDQTELMKKMMDDMGPVPEMSMEVPEYDHPGEPKGTDTVPAWLTPGEFVVNKEATEIYGDEIKAMNDHGRELQAAKGMEVPGYQTGGDVPFIAGPMLTDPKFMQDGGWIPQLKWDLTNKIPGTDAYNKKQAWLKEQRMKPKLHELTAQQEVNELFGKPSGSVLPDGRIIEKHPNFTGTHLEWMFLDPAKQQAFYKKEGGWVTDELLDKLMEVESGGDPEAVSPAGAIGLYQWLPSSAKQAGYGVKPFDPKDPKAARAATKKYLENMQKHHGFTPEETLRAYNWGPGNVINYNKGKRKDIPAEALNYPGKILGFDKVEGVPVHGEMPVPTPRPREDMSEAPGYWDQFKALFKQEGGPIDYTTGQYDVPNPNVVPEIKPGGHVMFGGNQNIGGQQINDPIEENAMTDIPIQSTGNVDDLAGVGGGDIPVESGGAGGDWWHNLLGAKSKEMLDLPLEEEDKAFLDKQTATSEKLASQDIAEEENLIADIAAEGSTEGIDEAPVKKETYAEKENKAKLLLEDAQLIAEADSDSVMQTGPGANQAGDNASEKTVEAAGEEAVKADPSLLGQVKDAFSDAFKSLFNPAELAKAAILYAGSRALGYSHGGSMQWVAGNYLENVQAAEQAKIKAQATKEKRAFELAKTDKFTPKSVSAYRKSGDPADLVSKKSVAGATSTGVTEQRIGPGGKKISIQQVKMPNGSTGYQLPNGKVVTKAWLENNSKPYDASFDKGTSEYRARRSRATKSMTELFKEIQGREDRFKVDQETKYKTGILPQQAAQDFWTFAESYGVDPESDEAQDLMGAAYRQAIQQSTIEGAPVAKNLKPFLEAAYIRQQSGAPQLFQVNPDKEEKESAKYVRSDKMNKFLKGLDDAAVVIPSLQNMPKTDQRNKLIGVLTDKWGKLSDDERKQWNRRANKGVETGFYLFAKKESDDFILDRKLGE